LAAASNAQASAALVAEVAAPYLAPRRRKRAQPFTSTTRYFRGRIIAALRTLEPGASLGLSELGPLVNPAFSAADDLPWLRNLVDGLARDGLARLDADPADAAGSQRVALP
jgi:A/G-specific adenine glycosylase